MKQLFSIVIIAAVASLTACQTAPAKTPPAKTVSVITAPLNAPVVDTSVTKNDADQIALEVFLVRHAEKKKDDRDPSLTEEGEVRADLLADMLSDANITHIHSSDYKRTRETAAPLAERLDIEVALYDPRDLPAMAERLKREGGRHLVVGHSNTTPQLTELLGGEGGEPIVEATEYNRLYLVTVAANGDTTSTLLRFGR